ncbi:MAG: hypothetical protein H7240_02390 [Glaciimonas sp.]|nr:hypothetical protein [Glaciimonas sp.]
MALYKKSSRRLSLVIEVQRGIGVTANAPNHHSKSPCMHGNLHHLQIRVPIEERLKNKAQGKPSLVKKSSLLK